MSKLKQLLFSLNETDRKIIEEKLKKQDCQINQLKQQLTETEQRFLEFQEDSIRNEQTYVRELAEKDKEIERLNKALEMCKHIERYDIGEMFLENAKLIIEKRQFAIRELQKAIDKLRDKSVLMYNSKDDFFGGFVSWYDLNIQIRKQIKKLKGENDEI